MPKKKKALSASTIGLRAKEARLAIGMTQKELAAAIDWNRGQTGISEIERDAARVEDLAFWARLAKTLKVPLDDLVG